MVAEQTEMENEAVDRSPRRYHTLLSDATETPLDSYIRQTVNEDISVPPVTTFIWCSPSFSVSLYLQRWSNLSLWLAVIFPFLFIFSSHSPLIYPGTTATYQLFPFYLTIFFLQPDSYLYPLPSFLSVISRPLPPSSSFIFSLFLSH